MGQGTRCSLIVLNYEGEEIIRPCLDTLLAAMSPEDELIVVDNASTDHGATIVRTEYEGRVKLIELTTNTYIFGLNEGLASAEGEYVAFLNNDIHVDPRFVDELVNGFTSPDVFAVVPRILDSAGREQGSRTAGYWSRGLLFFERLDHSASGTDCFFAVGGQSLFRKSALDQIGSIDPLFRPMYHEDIELSYRAWKSGWTIRYQPDSRVCHLGSYSSKRVFSSSDLRCFVRQNEYLMVWKLITSRRLLFTHFVLIVPRLGMALLKMDWPTLRGFARAMRRWREVLRSRRDVRHHFVLTDEDVLRRVGEESLNAGMNSIR